jgi:polysaccharide export outer membrane protein
MKRSAVFSLLLPFVLCAASADLREYMLGPDDQLKIWALGAEELSKDPVRVDPAGFLDLPQIGRVQAAGLTLDQLRGKLIERLRESVRQPQVSIDVVNFGSQPVSVIGSVTTPGVHQLRGHKTLVEVLALAGGLKDEAGPFVKISRSKQFGAIPLPGAQNDERYSTAEVNLRELLAAKDPSQNIAIQPNDVISVPRAELIYVIGEVRKPGGFPMSSRDSVPVLQALSLAEGYTPTSAPKNAKILRPKPNSTERQEIPVDLKLLLTGKSTETVMQANDVLFVPSSSSKKASARAVDVAVQAITGIAVWRLPLPR